MIEAINPFNNVDDNDRAVFITALDEFTKEVRHYSQGSSASVNKKLAKSAKNKVEVKASRFTIDEARILHFALLNLKETIVFAEKAGFDDDMSAQLHLTLDKFIPVLDEFVNS